jgi:hypothetical protein
MPFIRPMALCVALALPAAASADVVPWDPPRISSPMFESHAAFDPRTGDLYFVRSSPDFSGWRILTSHCTPDGWSEPRPPSFAGDGLEADPYFTPDGKTLYFISTRSTDGLKRPNDLDIWRLDRDASGKWGTPVRLPEPVNSTGAEWFPRPAPDGWLYFGSSRPGGLGKNDIWRAHEDATGKWRVEDLGPTINTAGDEYEPYPAPDGKRLVIMAEDGLYESFSDGKGGWLQKHKLGPDVDVNGTEIGALLSPSGRSMLFSRDTKGPDSGEFFLQRASPPEDWPPSCPAKKAQL